ncbi:hypothetical protein RugamoR64_05000 [Duganella rhizosphaerae]|uniref:DHH family phosphoesterase n=1 Tax=Duganella rhizosphaerae TaxID=2885763 RepID=UPI0030EA9553
MDAAHHYDVFNGDADGIFALHQMRLHTPLRAELVTGVKREIDLLRRVPDGCRGQVLVLDIALDSNSAALHRLLDGGAEVDYFDHHSADCAFAHPRLRLHCDGAPDVCTSILVDRHLQGRHRPWAVAAAFGDNLAEAACRLARRSGLDGDAVEALAQLGQVFNYNAYGECEQDLHIAPAALYRALAGHEHPFDFIAGSEIYRALCAGYRDDCARLQGLRPHAELGAGAVYILPASAWARRVSGVLANRLAAQHHGASFAVLNERDDGSYLVSVRSGAPLTHSANGFCQQFDTGGGRKAAAGINRLPAAELDRFMDSFRRYYTAPPAGLAGLITEEKPA